MPQITPIYAALLAGLFLWLSTRVILVRRSERVSLGDGGSRELERRIRAQGNCAEYAPMGLILILLAELQGGPGWVIHLLGITLVLGRVMHGLALSAQQYALRVPGMALTLIVIAAAALVVLGLAIF